MVDSILSVFKNVSKNNMIINTALADGIAANDVACVQKLIDEKTVKKNREQHDDATWSETVNGKQLVTL